MGHHSGFISVVGTKPRAIAPPFSLRSTFSCPSGGRFLGATNPPFVLSAPVKKVLVRKTCPIATAVPVDVAEDSFEDVVLKSDLPVLVDFYASWCGPCKLVAPLMDWAAAAYEGKLKVAKVDTENNESFVKRYGIYGLPTFAVFIDGDANGVQEGAMGKPALKKYIEKHAGLTTEY